MPAFLTDALELAIVSAVITAVIVAVTRLCFRRGKGLEEL
jgi:hypothetical protein